MLYKPDADLLSDLVTSLNAVPNRAFVYVNGALTQSAEDSVAQLTNARIIRSDHNVGLGFGLNAIVAAAAEEDHDRILLLDQDSTLPVVSRGRAWDAHGRSGRDGDEGRCDGAKIDPSGGWELCRKPLCAPRPDDSAYSWTPVDFLPTSGTLLSVQAWQEVGPFRADYFIDGIDVEWGFRAWSKGWAALLCEDLVMTHRWGHDAADEVNALQILRQSDVRLFYYIRNAAYGLHLDHIPLRWKLRVLARLAAQIGITLVAHRGRRETWRLVSRALADAQAQRLGPISLDVSP